MKAAPAEVGGRRRFVLVGDPVVHSRSPAMHAEAFAVLGLEAEYRLLRVPADEPEAVAPALRRHAGAGGGNVTAPHKAHAALALDEAMPAVQETGACNCFWETGHGRLAGDNTDVTGIENLLRDRLAGVPAGDVLIVGAGGAAAAAAVAAGRHRAVLLRVANRTPARAESLVRRLRGLGLPARAEPWPPAGTCDVVINATPLGRERGDAPPVSFDRVTARLALDLVYPSSSGFDAATTDWVRSARARGIEAVDGLEVLARQAAACYPHWFGVEVPVDVLQRAARAGGRPEVADGPPD